MSLKIDPTESAIDSAYKIIKYWEGGNSYDKNDAASNSIPKELNGLHTVKGVTWQTFKSCAYPILGIQPNYKNFMSLSDKEVKSIFERNYWKYYGCDKIISKPIAIMVADFAFNAGNNAIICLQRAINVIRRTENKTILLEDGINGEITIRTTNECEPKQLLTEYYIKRAEFYKYIATGKNSVFLKGWNNRNNQVKVLCDTLL